jgi:hypothetical protein
MLSGSCVPPAERKDVVELESIRSVLDPADITQDFLEAHSGDKGVALSRAAVAPPVVTAIP